MPPPPPPPHVAKLGKGKSRSAIKNAIRRETSLFMGGALFSSTEIRYRGPASMPNPFRYRCRNCPKSRMLRGKVRVEIPLHNCSAAGRIKTGFTESSGRERKARAPHQGERYDCVRREWD